MPVETWKSIADWATIVLIALTVVSGSAALILGDRINEKQAEQLRKFNEDLAAARNGLSAQEERAAKAEQDLEKERKQRLEMEKAVAPRLVDEEKLSNALRSIPSISVRIVSSPEGEPWRLAGALASAFELGGWHVLSPMRRDLDTGFEDMNGVTVWATVGLPRPGDHSLDAARLVVSELKAQGIKSRQMPAGDELPPNTILVRIGLKPIEHFGSKGQGLLYK